MSAASQEAEATTDGTLAPRATGALEWVRRCECSSGVNLVL